MPQNKNRIVRKAPLRKYIEQNTPRFKGRRAQLRVYINNEGETFTVQRNYSGRNTLGKGEKKFSITINKKDEGVFANAILLIAPKTQLYSIAGREIFIFDTAINAYHQNPPLKNGRHIFQIVIDECKQLAIKEFGNKPYYITLKANNEKTAQHYAKFGFEKMTTNPIKMRLRIDANSKS